MKRMSTLLATLVLLVVCALLLPAEAQAAETSGSCGENVTWTFDEATGTLTISGEGEMTDNPWYDYDDRITSVVIKSGVTNIEPSAFADCTSLTSITIPDSVTSIGSGAFKGCVGLTRVTLPDSITSLGGWTFCDCISLTNITLSNNITYIGYGVFTNCSKLNNISLPASVTIIDYQAFYGCTGLTSITFPSSLTEIGVNAFDGCTNLTSIAIPDSVTTIWTTAFDNCSNLWHILYAGTEEQLNNMAFKFATESAGRVFYHTTTYQETELSKITLHTNCTGNEITDAASKSCTVCMANCDHNYGGGKVVKDPTCKHEGETIFICSVCGHTKTEAIAKLSDHSFDNGKVTKEPTCNAAGVKTYICTVCGDTKTESIAKLSIHSFDSGKVTKEPTCKAEGVKTFTCTVCGSTKTESIAKLPKPENSILEITDGTFEYHSAVTGELETYTFDYSDAWLLEDSTNYNHDLAKMSIRMAMSAARTTPGSIEKLFSTLKFTDETTIDYPSPKVDTIGYAIGSKTILAEDGKEYTLIAVAVRGGGYESEWASNFTIGNTSEHQGFSDAAEKVCKAVESHIKKIGAKKNIKVWIAGYSRAAATSNIAAHNLTADAKNGRIKGLSADSVFAYCFECPRTVRTDHPSYATKDNNIFNIVNAIDLVPMVAPQAWKFDRYGTTYYLPASEVNYKGFQTAFSKMKTEYGLILSHVGSDTNLSSLTAYSKSQCTDLNDVIDALAAYFWDQSTYVLGYQSTVADSLKSFTGGDFEIKAVTELVLGVVPAFPILHPIATAKLIGNLGNVACAHYPELCLAWMDSLSGMEEYVDSRTRYLRINCPVDISVYDSNGTLVAQIINDVVQEIESSTIGAVVDENGQKVVVLPPDEAFKVVVTATNDGTMSYQIEEHDIGTGNSTRVVNYYDVDIQKGDELNGTIGIQSTPDTMYALADSDGKQISTTNDLRGNEITEHTISVNANGNGTVTGGGICTVGEYVQVTASANEGHVFLGWYIDEQLVSHEAAYRFRAEDSVSIIGRFDAEQPTTVAPTTVPVTTVAPTTVPITTAAPTVAPNTAPVETTAPETTVAPVETAAPTTVPMTTVAPTEPEVTTTAPVETTAPETTVTESEPTTTAPVQTTAPATTVTDPATTTPGEDAPDGGNPTLIVVIVSVVVVLGIGVGAFLVIKKKK